MNRINTTIVAAMSAGLMFGEQKARAHCDSLDGPVAQAILKALGTGNIGTSRTGIWSLTETNPHTSPETSRRPSANMGPIAVAAGRALI
jgi:hypothetical protein